MAVRAKPKLSMYGLHWDYDDPADVEAFLYSHGGYYTVRNKTYGLGPKHHFKELIKLLAPWFVLHKWSEMIIDAWAEYDTIAVLGPASSGKTFTAAMCAYAEFFVHPVGTSILCSSITLPGLKLRVWGALTEIVRKVKELRPDAPGYVVDSDLRVYPSEPKDEERRNPKHAIIGLACKSGDEWVGLGPFVGIHNERVFGIFDEASLMPRSFWDATANLRKSPKTKFVALGNPKDPTDALGVIAEPHKELGGWEGIGQPTSTTTWKAVGTNAIAIQLYGPDGPNFNTDKPKFPFLITPKQLEEDKIRYGEDSWQFQMMDLGVMPKGFGSRRVITRAMCERGNAFGEPIWDESTPMIDYIGVDPALALEDGDRTVLVRLTVGRDVNGVQIIAFTDGPYVVPVGSKKFDIDGKQLTGEEQIATFVRDYCVPRNIPAHRVAFDSTGRGALALAFARIWSPQVVPIEFGGKAPDRIAITGSAKLESDLYGKMVSALWFAMRNAIVAGQVRGMPRSVFEEGCMREFIVKNGKEDVEPKVHTRHRLGKSPDLFDAACAALELARRNGFMIGGQASKFSGPIRVKWLEEKQRQFLEVKRNYDLAEA